MCELKAEKRNTNYIHTLITLIHIYLPIWENVRGHKEMHIALLYTKQL